ncbi:DNA polymerase-3 subunit alpha [Pedobacter steynii]|uniref:DNA-directed DNA polymerase n=1 Tax=Pedobacter steynii TaxID=430522 RepID=A0A1H0C8D8_9SPHI|nr:DNA polymerase III subunit alpha [Pedobacter steynii]NQX41497.1 DNA polymerase III subunit alpha [Pedobacter steynii]SDN54148.1 DNA polymerase-3 subunit alpha [Pedobacter steynii]
MYLNVHSQYSLRYGTMSIRTLVDEALARGITQMVITDINNSTGVMEFMRECRKKKIKPIGGIEFRRDKKLLYIGIARNKEGMKELNDFLTDHNLNQKELPDQPGEFKNVYVVYPYGQNRELKSNEYIGLRFDELYQLYNKDLTAFQDKMLALQPVFVANRIEYRLHEYLRGIDLNTLLTMVEQEDKCKETDVFLNPGDLESKFSKYAFILDNTRRVMDSCTMDYPEGQLKLNRKTFTGNKKDDNALLEKLATEGMFYRYGNKNRVALKRIRQELKVIVELDFCAYFLITNDIIQYSMRRGYYHVGRGSGANSIVAYCLRITDVDPITLDLYFERFLNVERSSAPDFDIDYSWDEREDVQDYIFKRYGREHTALLGTMSTFKDRSVIREIGKVMGLPKTEIDGFTDPASAAANRDNVTFKKIMAIHSMMGNMPNQRSIHAGGVLISEEPITYYTALDLPPKGMPTVQWDMYEAEAIGYDKYDILSQRGIGHIKEAVKLVAQNQQKNLDIHQVQQFMKDPHLNNRLKSGNTIGCFYIESPAMRQLLTKLSCDNYLTLVAASSIIRPGVAQSGMMKTYIYSFHHPDQVQYLHPVMEAQLKETFGVMVYQEDVIKICIHYGGMDGADADILRRGMSGKYRSRVEFDKLVEKFHEGAKALGRPEAVTNEVWRQVSSFAGYSFSKAHSASFAVESYQSLYLKTYFPIEFMVGVLNNYGGFYSRWLYVHELKKSGANVHLPCVNNSSSVVSIAGIDVYLGFVGIQGLEGRLIELIPEERKHNGDYLHLEDFVKRTEIGLEQAILLIRCGALRFTGKSKKTLLWEVHTLLGNKLKPNNHAELFHVEAKHYTLPDLVNTAQEDAYHELELLGFPLSLSMFDLLKTEYRGDVRVNDLIKHLGQTVKMVGLYVCEKTVHARNNKKMWFGTFLDADGNFFDTTHFSNHTPVYPFRGAGCYLILGKVVEDFGFPSVEVIKFAKLPILNNPVMD